MAKETDTRDIAMKAITKIDTHIDACERRYQEGAQRLERLYTFIQEAHKENRKDIVDIKGVLAEQRGAGKMAKALAAAGAGIMGVIGGVGGSHLIK